MVGSAEEGGGGGGENEEARGVGNGDRGLWAVVSAT